MSRLTTAERRRIYLAQRQAHAATLALLRTPEAPTAARPTSGRRRILVVTALAALAGGLALASRVVEFHPPTSLLDALLPRL
jgi:hypothetical protein